MKFQYNSIGNQGMFIDDKTKVFNNQVFKWKVDITHIHQNFPFALQSRVNPHFHSHTLTWNYHQPLHGCDTPKKLWIRDRLGCDIHNEVLPLTLQSEIKQHQIISLIKGNC